MRETAKHRDAFLVWYEQGRHFEQTISKLEVTNPTLANWIKAFDWHERADKLDAKAQAKMDAKLINERIKRQAQMNENHYQLGQGMIARSSEYLKNNKLESAAEAVSAGKAGVESENQPRAARFARFVLRGWLIG